VTIGTQHTLSMRFGEKINATKNTHIPSGMFLGVPLIAELVKYFEDKYTHLEVCSVWIIKKLRENDGFQRWNRDFYLRTEVTTTIVINVGAVRNTLSLLYKYHQPGYHQLTGEVKR
jgi:hypothetical protein